MQSPGISCKAKDKNVSCSKEKIISLQERIPAAEARYQKALRDLGAEQCGVEEVISALRDLWNARADLECVQVREACETVLFGGSALFEQSNNLPIM